jgi:hypothetical protein
MGAKRLLPKKIFVELEIVQVLTAISPDSNAFAILPLLWIE